MDEVEDKKAHRERVIAVFAELRRTTIPGLGMRDLMDALRLIDGGWEYDSLSDGENSLKKYVRMLWCRGVSAEDREFERLWEKHTATTEPPTRTEAKTSSAREMGKAIEPERARQQPPSQSPSPSEQTERKRPVVSAVPIKAPMGLALHPGPREIGSHWPISRRSMSYGWGFLRRPRGDGPLTVLDIDTTVNETARRGFFLEPVFSRALCNHARLVLLVDRSDSMIPFSNLVRDLMETGHQARMEGSLSSVESYFFRDVVTDHLYSDLYLTDLVKTEEPNRRLISPEEALSDEGRDTSLLIISDAGVKPEKSEVQIERIIETQEMLLRLSMITPLIAWLNPWPRERWKNTAADMISSLAPMFEITKSGFLDAIKTLQGKTSNRKYQE